MKLKNGIFHDEAFRAIKQKRYVMIGSGHNHMNFLYVKDLVDVLIKVKDEPMVANQTYIVADTPITLKDFTNLTRKEFGFPPVISVVFPGWQD